VTKLMVESIEGLTFEDEGVFTPTATSRILAKSAENLIPFGSSVLDLGCGSGIVGLELAHKSKRISSLGMSDIGGRATDLARENARLLGVEADVRTGSLFEPWEGQGLFDVIISDVSGVVPELGARFGWFNGVSNDSGSGGAGLAVSVLGRANQHLTPKGKLIFPVISLSDEKEILDAANQSFQNVDLVSEAPIPLDITSAELQEFSRRYPMVRTGLLGGIPVFYTSVYLCSN